MAALITNMPTFTPFSFEQYIAPLQEYKKEYDRVEQQYNELQSAASVLEKLRADAPDSQAYQIYNNYMDALQGETDALASNGLTPGHRRILNSMRNQYRTNLIPIIAGVQKWEEAKKRQDDLKEGEKLNYNPYNMSVDEFIGNNPDFRLLDLNTVYDKGTAQAKAQSERQYQNPNYKLAADGLHYAYSRIQGYLNDTASTKKELNTLISDLNTYAKRLDDNAQSASFGVSGLVDYLKTLNLGEMDQDTAKEILHSAISGYTQGLTGQLQTSFLGGSGSRNSSNNGIPTQTVTAFVPKTRIIPYNSNDNVNKTLDESAKAVQRATSNNLNLQGFTRDDDGNYHLNPGTLQMHNEGDGVAFMSDNFEIEVTVENILRNYKKFTNPNKSFTLKDHGNSKQDQKAYDDKIRNIIAQDEASGNPSTASLTLKKQIGTNPTIPGTEAPMETAKAILSVLKLVDTNTYNKITKGTLSESDDLETLINSALDQYNSKLGDYGISEKIVPYATDENSQSFLMQQVKNYAQSNDWKLHEVGYTDDGKSYTGTNSKSISVDKILNDVNTRIVELDYLPSDDNFIKLVINHKKGNGTEDVEVVVPATAISTEFTGVMQGMKQSYGQLSAIEQTNGKFQSPGTKPINTWSEGEKLFVKIQNILSNNTDNVDINTLLQQKLSEEEYRLYSQYNAAKTLANGTYNQFVQHLGMTTAPVSIAPNKADTQQTITVYGY